MIVEDNFTVPVPVEKVWAFLQDIPQMSTCVPGVEEVTEVAPDTYRGRVSVQVGPLKASFGGEARIVQREPMSRMVAEVKGEDPRLASIVEGQFEGLLEPTEGGTTLTYRIHLSLRGRIAQLGAPVIRATAQKVANSFAECLERTLRREQEGAP